MTAVVIDAGAAAVAAAKEASGETTAVSKSSASWGLLNLGGPGWFADIVDVDIRVHTAHHVRAYNFLFHDALPVIDASSTLSGTITVAPPAGWGVWQGGITIRVEEQLYFYESLRAVATRTFEEEVFAAQKVGPDKLEVEFELDLEGGRLTESYDGEIFSIRHLLTVTVKRPWWTFDVQKVQPLAFQRPADPRAAAAAAAAARDPAGTDAAIIEQNRADALDAEERIEASYAAVDEAGNVLVSRSNILCVSDYGGKCEMRFGVDGASGTVCAVGDTLRGTVRVWGMREGLALEKILVLLYKIERGDGEEFECAIREVDVTATGQRVDGGGGGTGAGAGAAVSAEGVDVDVDVSAKESPAAAAAAAAPSSSASRSAEITELAVPGKEPAAFTFELPLAPSGDGASVGPTFEGVHVPAEDEDDEDNVEEVSVRYYLRLTLETADGERFWNTHEMLLRRTRIVADDGVVVDDGDAGEEETSEKKLQRVQSSV